MELKIQPLPDAGRSALFLGGVGPLTLSAEVRPSSIRLGKRLEFRLTLDGPGALGSTGRPQLAGPALTALAIRSEPLPDEVTDDPPRRIIRWSLRPFRPGKASLAPVALATFDPRSQRYWTQASRSLSLLVDDLPGFDSRVLPVAVSPEPSSRRVNTVLAEFLGGVVLLGVGAWWAARWNASARRPEALARRFARRWLKQLDSNGPRVDDLDTLAREIPQGLAGYLQLAIERPIGTLTPVEAEAALAQSTGMTDLAVLAGELIDCCDRIRYGGVHAASGELAGRAREVFRKLAGAL